CRYARGCAHLSLWIVYRPAGCRPSPRTPRPLDGAAARGAVVSSSASCAPPCACWPSDRPRRWAAAGAVLDPTRRRSPAGPGAVHCGRGGAVARGSPRRAGHLCPGEPGDDRRHVLALALEERVVRDAIPLPVALEILDHLLVAAHQHVG